MRCHANDSDPKFTLLSSSGLYKMKRNGYNTFVPGKFRPPRIDPALHVFRNSTLRAYFPPDALNPKIIMIQARAGQGKSVFAAQFLQHSKSNFSWVQVGAEDRDPVVFISAILTALMKSMPELEQSVLYQSILSGEMAEAEPTTLVSILVNEIKPLLKNNFYLCIDDLHLLKKFEVNLTFLNVLVDRSPPALHFIFLAREPVALTLSREKTLYLSNSDLAWSNKDVATLFTRILKKPISSDTLAELQKITEGWVMGLILAGHILSNSSNNPSSKRLNRRIVDEPNRFRVYFSNEILDSLNHKQRHAVLLLALLDHIPVELAASLDLVPDIGAFLEDLVQRNFFLQRLEDSTSGYKFHHLFQEFLKARAAEELPLQERRRMLALAGRWHLRQNRHEQAIHYYLQANAYGMVEKIVRTVGLHLIATNRVITIKETIDKIPRKVIQTHAWLSFFVATVYSEKDPLGSKIYLEQALSMFIDRQDELGELFVLTSLMTYHVGIDSQFEKGRKLLSRAEALYAKMSDKLHRAAYIQPAYSIAQCLTFCACRLSRAATYTDAIFHLAWKKKLDNAMAGAVQARALIYMCRGDWDTYIEDIEQSLFLMQSPRVSNLNKLYLHLAQFVFLAMSGDFRTYRHYKILLRNRQDVGLLINTMVASTILIMDIKIALAEGRLEEAMQLVYQGMASVGGGMTAHIQAHNMAYYAYLSALDGQTGNAVAAVVKSAALRKEAGGPYHEISGNILLGGAYALCGHYKEADAILKQAICDSRAMGLVLLNASAYAQRAFLRLTTKHIQEALEDIAVCLKIMKRDRRVTLFAWNPHVMLTILKAAVVHKVEAKYALKLAEQRLQISLSPYGEQIPLLEIVCLGGLQLKLESEVEITSAELTSFQRELMALLAGATDNSVLHSRLQELFWPGQDSGKNRNRLDRQLSRFRKILDLLLAPHFAKNYISVDKGVVRLHHCRIDANRFMDDILQGKHHLAKQKYWQAGTAFLRAHHSYTGEFMAGVRLRGRLASIREKLHRSYLENAQLLARIMIELQYFKEAIQVCRQALEHDPAYEALVKLLYNLRIQGKKPLKARQVIVDYQNALRQDGFCEMEIKEIMAQFWITQNIIDWPVPLLVQ